MALVYAFVGSMFDDAFADIDHSEIIAEIQVSQRELSGAWILFFSKLSKSTFFVNGVLSDIY